MTLTKEIKKLGVPRYEKERTLVRSVGIKNCPQKNVVLELYAGNGGMTDLYKVDFKKIITNDIDKNSTAEYKMSASRFIKEILPTIKEKIDLVDFDCYGNPMYEIQEFFETVKDTMKPIVVCITDGLGLSMKRQRNEEGIKERFMLTPKDLKDINLEFSWLYHPQLTKCFFNNLGNKYRMKARPLYAIIGKGKNFFFSSWLFF